MSGISEHWIRDSYHIKYSLELHLPKSSTFGIMLWSAENHFQNCINFDFFNDLKEKKPMEERTIITRNMSMSKGKSAII